MTAKILVIGATSAIAAACGRIWAQRGAHLFLAGRDAAKLDAVAADLRVRGAASVGTRGLDVNDLDAHGALVDAAAAALGGLDVVFIAHGTLPDQARCEADPALALREFATNATATIALLTRAASELERRGQGAIAVITSVAGDRGRPSNYVYGSAKAAVSVFCDGLRARLFRAGVSVTDIRPGFVATPMTAGLPLPGPLVAQPQDIAPRIVRAIERRADVVYVPAFWALVMAIIRHIPRPLFKRMTL
jgi:short-subunit dehydrogenase